MDPAPREVFLIPGDQLNVSVYRQPDLGCDILIPQEGSFTFPLIGSVQAAGRTARELERHIQERLARDFMHDPQVIVQVRQYARRSLFVIGGVLKPGLYELRPTERVTLLQLVAMAGGFTDKAYKEFVHIVRRREGAEREVIPLSVVDLERAVSGGRASADPELRPDDLVVIPSASRVAYVMGSVQKPGSIDLPSDARVTASMAVSEAGGFTKFASAGRAQVLRHLPTGETEKIPVDLNAVLEGRLDRDVELRPGDLVFVPDRGLF